MHTLHPGRISFGVGMLRVRGLLARYSLDHGYLCLSRVLNSKTDKVIECEILSRMCYSGEPYFLSSLDYSNPRVLKALLTGRDPPISEYLNDVCTVNIHPDTARYLARCFISSELPDKAIKLCSVMSSLDSSILKVIVGSSVVPEKLNELARICHSTDIDSSTSAESLWWACEVLIALSEEPSNGVRDVLKHVLVSMKLHLPVNSIEVTMARYHLCLQELSIQTPCWDTIEDLVVLLTRSSPKLVHISVLTVDCLIHVASIIGAMRKPLLVEALLTAAIGMHHRIHTSGISAPDCDAQLSAAYILLGNAELSLEKHSLAAENFKMALTLKRLRSASNVSVAPVIYNLGRAYLADNNLAAAYKAFTESLAIYESQSTPRSQGKSLDVADLRFALSEACFKMQRLAEAEMHMRACVISRKNVFGTHLQTAIAMDQLAALLISRNETTEAKSLLLESIDTYKLLYSSGEHSGYYYMCLQKLANVYIMAESYADAAKCLDQCMVQLKNMYPPVSYRQLLFQYHNVLSMCGRQKDAYNVQLQINGKE